MDVASVESVAKQKWETHFGVETQKSRQLLIRFRHEEMSVVANDRPLHGDHHLEPKIRLKCWFCTVCSVKVILLKLLFTNTSLVHQKCIQLT